MSTLDVLVAHPPRLDRCLESATLVHNSGKYKMPFSDSQGHTGNRGD